MAHPAKTPRAATATPRPTAVGVLAALTAALAAALAGAPLAADDRDLLRFDTAKPYLMILLDTSASMNLATGAGDLPVPGFGDDPGSRLYQAKTALFDVFESSSEFHFGFAAFNQDEARVVAKHWLYYSDQSPPESWPLDYPTPDPDGLTQVIDTLTEDTDGDGVPDSGDGVPDTVVNDVEGDAMVFGAHLQLGTPGRAATCFEPLDLSDPFERAQVNAFARLDADADATTTIWVTDAVTGRTYRLRHRREGGSLGGDGLAVEFDLDRVERCILDDIPIFDRSWEHEFVLRLDPNLDELLMVDGVPVQGGDAVPGLWDWQDARTSATCDTGGPFTGNGWEGNYDSGVVTGDSTFDANVTDVDNLCADPFDPASCLPLKPVLETQLSAFGRELDRGDLLPFDWVDDNKLAFLRRLAPNYPDGEPDFRVSPYLREDVNGDGLLDLVDVDERPLVAMGESPIGAAVLDMRCWYQGTEGSGGESKCRNSAFQSEGWAQVACTFDSEFGCRRPFLIVISDGDDTCPGENPGADSASLRSHSGVRTWSINLGDPKNCTSGAQGNVLFKIANNGGGECKNVSNAEELRIALEEILGEIVEESRSFASAAVPSIQATADQSIYVTRFTPIDDAAVWDGHVDAFLKPLPTDDEGRPDVTDPNHLWDAGEVLATEQANAADPLGPGAGQRRVYYGRRLGEGTWTAGRRLLDPVASASEPVRYDLWRGMGLISAGTPDGSLTQAEEDAHEAEVERVIDRTFELKSADVGDPPVTISYLLGEIFHSTPLVVGTPVNSDYFAFDLGADQDQDCKADDSGGQANRGYRCFVERQRFRRKALVAGANDGMVHAFDAGLFDPGTGRYDNGSGHELFGWVPRTVLPTVRAVTESFATHRFSVDGTVSVADAFLDPVHEGVPSAAERLWRSVLIGGLREGGRGYYALDITQPDPIELQADGSFAPATGSDYVPICADGGAGCGPTSYPTVLWEFEDTTAGSLLTTDPPDVPKGMDEDGNGHRDLGDTWSQPTLGRLQLCEGAECDPTVAGNDVRDRYVAVFGGGLDAEESVALDGSIETRFGNFLYIVDIELGKVLYKRRVEGSVPGQPAAVDTDQDGYLDRVYFGTTAGILYRVDLGADADGRVPALDEISASDVEGVLHIVQRVQFDSAGGVAWEARPIFDASFDGGVATEIPRPIFHRPSVLFVAQLGFYAVAFGSGDREDLWSTALPPDAAPDDPPQSGRFYLFTDDSHLLDPAALPLTETSLTPVALDDPAVDQDLLVAPPPGERGWFLHLEPNERVITDAFGLSGVTVFSSFQPDLAITDADGDPVDGGGTCSSGDQDATDRRCSKSGTSRIFVLSATNADPFLTDAAGQRTRYFEVSTFVTNPYTELSGGAATSGGADGGDEVDSLTIDEQALMEELMGLFPANCSFANYWIHIKSISADTRIQRIAPVPVCLVEKNWREF